MKNLIKILLPILVSSQSVLAAETGITVTPKGSLDFSFGAIKDNGPSSGKSITANRKDMAFFSSAGVSLNIANRLDDDLAYGAKIGLATAAMSDRKAPTMAWFESPAGKLEFGSDKGATAKMRITGYSNASGTGGMWDMWGKPDIRKRGIHYVTNPGNFLDQKTRSPKDLEFARKITYFTPEFNGFQAGISYILDTTNNGQKPISEPERHIHALVHGYSFDFKDGIGWGVSQKIKVDEDLSFRASVTGECAKVVPHITPPSTPPSNIPSQVVRGAKFKNLRTYSVGAEVKYANIGVSGGYSNFMKSITSDAIDAPGRKKSDLYSIGGKYSFEQLSMSITYFSSDHRKNKLHATTVAADYKLAPGLMPYAEITAFNASGWYLNNNRVFTTDSHKGTLFLLGMRMEF